MCGVYGKLGDRD